VTVCRAVFTLLSFWLRELNPPTASEVAALFRAALARELRRCSG
jgi:hypothetical protein